MKKQKEHERRIVGREVSGIVGDITKSVDYGNNVLPLPFRALNTPRNVSPEEQMDVDSNLETETMETTTTAVTTTTISITKKKKQTQTHRRTSSQADEKWKKAWPRDKPHHAQIQNRTPGGKITKGMKTGQSLGRRSGTGTQTCFL